MSKRLTTLSEVKEIFKEYKEKVSVSCDEMHGHSARRGCLSGDPKDVLICQLCEIVFYLESAMDATKKEIDNWMERLKRKE